MPKSLHFQTKKASLSEDTAFLSGTERSVALEHEEPEDPTLIHKTIRRSQRGTEGESSSDTWSNI